MPAAATPLSDAIVARIGKRGLFALERLMGMLLVANSVEMFLSGMKEYGHSGG